MDNTDKREIDKDLETWLKETSNGMLAYALKKATGKTMLVLKTDGIYTDIVFDNIRIHSWFSHFGVNADYEEPGTPDIVLPLYTWVKCAALRTAAAIVHEDKGINVVTDNVLSTAQACSLAGLPQFNLAKEIEKERSTLQVEPDSSSILEDNKKHDEIAEFLSGLMGYDNKQYVVEKEIVDFVLKGMNEILHPEFSIHRNTLTNEIYIEVPHQSIKDVEEQSPLFINKIKGIVDYFYNNAAVQERIHS